jgi:hypothetical protein
LGTYPEDELPAAATMSLEVDVLPIADTNEETGRLADEIEGVAGEWSLFEQSHGFNIDGVDLDTTILPDGWRERLVKVQNANTAPPSGAPERFARTFRSRLAAARRELGEDALPEIHLHDLRHTHATLLLHDGVPVKVVSERLGHASPMITLSVYAHVMPGMQREAAASFAAMVLGGAS